MYFHSLRDTWEDNRTNVTTNAREGHLKLRFQRQAFSAAVPTGERDWSEPPRCPAGAEMVTTTSSISSEKVYPV